MSTISRISPGLSDLFFNHSLDNRAELFAWARATDVAVTEEAERRVVLLDAESFCAQLKAAYGIVEDPAALVDDFMGRR